MQDINAVHGITQYLMLGDFEGIRRFCQLEDVSDRVRAWALAKVYDKSLSKQQKLLLDGTLLDQYEGWQCYFLGQYVESHVFFMSAYQANTEDGYGVGLGLAKVYTRLGYWETAKQWLLYELPKARQCNDLFLQAQCYGALGEVFLRAGYAKLAYECFGHAFYVLPKGSSQREKQYNYQASALIRTGNKEQAEQCLMSALYLAAGKNVDSVWHSLARLQFLWLEQGRTDYVKDCYADYLQEKPNVEIAEGFLNVAEAFLAYQQQEFNRAVDCIKKALGCFKSFPTEKVWAKKLLQVLENTAFDHLVFDSVEFVFPPKNNRNLIEKSWLGSVLSNQGFQVIKTAQSWDELYKARLLFFI